MKFENQTKKTMEVHTASRQLFKATTWRLSATLTTIVLAVLLSVSLPCLVGWPTYKSYSLSNFSILPRHCTFNVCRYYQTLIIYCRGNPSRRYSATSGLLGQCIENRIAGGYQVHCHCSFLLRFFSFPFLHNPRPRSMCTFIVKHTERY